MKIFIFIYSQESRSDRVDSWRSWKSGGKKAKGTFRPPKPKAEKRQYSCACAMCVSMQLSIVYLIVLTDDREKCDMIPYSSYVHEPNSIEGCCSQTFHSSAIVLMLSCQLQLMMMMTMFIRLFCHLHCISIVWVVVFQLYASTLNMALCIYWYFSTLNNFLIPVCNNFCFVFQCSKVKMIIFQSVMDNIIF